jgi:hypothetical protein
MPNSEYSTEIGSVVTAAAGNHRMRVYQRLASSDRAMVDRWSLRIGLFYIAVAIGGTLAISLTSEIRTGGAQTAAADSKSPVSPAMTNHGVDEPERPRTGLQPVLLQKR